MTFSAVPAAAASPAPAGPRGAPCPPPLGALLLGAGALLTACATPPAAPPRPAVDLPAAFTEGDRTPARWPSQDWYRDFGSQELNTLIEAAVRASPDLEAARARVRQADARARQAGAALLPGVSANGAGTEFAGRSSQGSGHELDWSALLTASYETDFWGRLRATHASAQLSASAARAERDTLALTTLAAVADAYFQVLALRERLAVAESSRQTATTLLAVVQARFDVSMAGPIELSTQKATLDAAQIALTELRQAESEARASLALLLGRPPERFEVTGEPLASLREPAVAAGLPSALLTRRPDVFLAESNLAAGHADLLAARAAMFPDLALTVSGGAQNPALPAAVLTIPGIGPSLALSASLTQPIFDHGRLAARTEEARAKEQELLATYRSSLLAALGDVETALGALQHLDAAAAYQIDNRDQAERAFEGARLRYQAGTLDFLTLLEAQRSLYAARDQLIQHRLMRLRALVGLCKALGGGWQAPDTPSHGNPNPGPSP